MKMSQTAVRHT